MNEPHDDLERWLRPSVDPMNVPEGAFASIRRRARRRRWAHAVSTVAAVAVVAFGGISGGLLLTGDGEGGGIVVPPPPVASSPSHSPAPGSASPDGSPSPRSPSAAPSTSQDTPADDPTDESEQREPPASGQQEGRAPSAESPTPGETGTERPDTDVSVCERSQLSAESHVEGAASGSVYWEFVFTNESDTGCSVGGHPEVVLLDGDMNRLPTQQYSIPPEPSQLVLEPGESGAVTIQAPNVRDPEDECQPPSQYARFTPGDGQLTVSFESRACHGRTGVSGVHQ